MKHTKFTPEDIRALRKRLKMTQRQFADLLGFKAGSRISELENGRIKPSGKTVKLLELYKEK